MKMTKYWLNENFMVKIWSLKRSKKDKRNQLLSQKIKKRENLYIGNQISIKVKYDICHSILYIHTHIYELNNY